MCIRDRSTGSTFNTSKFNLQGIDVSEDSEEALLPAPTYELEVYTVQQSADQEWHEIHGTSTNVERSNYNDDTTSAVATRFMGAFEAGERPTPIGINIPNTFVFYLNSVDQSVITAVGFSIVGGTTTETTSPFTWRPASTLPTGWNPTWSVGSTIANYVDSVVIQDTMRNPNDEDNQVKVTVTLVPTFVMPSNGIEIKIPLTETISQDQDRGNSDWEPTTPTTINIIVNTPTTTGRPAYITGE